jgi:heat-inducible transcriptional repressor
MAFENLSDREQRILEHLIEHYITTADPVGSRIIANKYKIGVSPATIRNTMQDLEELGLIRQPHTSAGRVPTDTGYRVFVDMLIKPEPLTKAEESKIRNLINANAGRGLDAILSQTSKILGEITSQLGLSIAPDFEEGTLVRIDLIPVADGKILMVVSVKSGLARSILLEVESHIEIKELQHIESVLNERLTGLTLGQIRNTLAERLADTQCNPKLIKLFIDPEYDIWVDKDSKKLHITGTDNLIVKPEFADRGKLSDVIKLIEEKKELKKFIDSKSDAEGIIITIGSENPISEIQSCSLVTSNYKVGKISGTIGIIGPTRMPYSKLVSLVEYTARSLTEALSAS